MRADGANTIAEPGDFSLKDVVAIYLQQSVSINQLWAMYVVAFATGVAFAITLAKNGSMVLLVATAIGFAAFATGNARLILLGHRILQAASSDIRRAIEMREEGVGSAALRRMAAPRASVAFVMAIHGTVDLCLLSAYVYTGMILARS